MDEKLHKLIDSFDCEFDKCDSIDERIFVLRRYAEIVLFKMYGKSLKKAKKQRTKPVFHKKNTCECCGENIDDTVKHRIIPLRHGGINHRKNIIELCRECQYEINTWMHNEDDVYNTEYCEEMLDLDREFQQKMEEI